MESSSESSSSNSSSSSGSSEFTSRGLSNGGGFSFQKTRGLRRVTFTKRARQEGFLLDSDGFYIVVKPEVPVPYYEQTYYWNRQYYISHPEKHMCVKEVIEDDSDLFKIRLNDSTLTEIVFGCSNEDQCCEFDCCNMNKRIIVIIIIVIIMCGYLCCTSDCMNRQVAEFNEQQELKKRQQEEQEMAQQQQQPPNPQLCQDHQDHEDDSKQPLDQQQQQQQQQPLIRPSAPLLPSNDI